jgi:hypothetical protein
MSEASGGGRTEITKPCRTVTTVRGEPTGTIGTSSRATANSGSVALATAGPSKQALQGRSVVRALSSCRVLKPAKAHVCTDCVTLAAIKRIAMKMPVVDRRAILQSLRSTVSAVRCKKPPSNT